MSLAFYWPLVLLVVAHTLYQISAKSVPASMDPYAAVFFNYVIATTLAFILWMVMGQDRSLTGQLSKMNWAPVLMALSITTVEVSSIFMYKLGWNISLGTTIANVVLAVVLVIVGVLLYRETLSIQQLLGIGLCIAGVVLLNRQ